MRLPRRAWLLGSLGALAAACVRPTPRAEPPTPVPNALSQLEPLAATAGSILTDALDALRVFDAFAAYRIGVSVESSFRTPSELRWDPPTSSDWDEATRVALGTHGRAAQVLVAVGRAEYDPSAWRERREFADAVQDLLDLGDALAAYRQRVDRLAPGGDGSGALDLLTRAWAQFDAAAARWGMGRGVLIG